MNLTEQEQWKACGDLELSCECGVGRHSLDFANSRTDLRTSLLQKFIQRPISLQRGQGFGVQNCGRDVLFSLNHRLAIGGTRARKVEQGSVWRKIQSSSQLRGGGDHFTVKAGCARLIP